MSVERIQLRRGTTAAWAAANPILFLGEFGVEKTVDDAVLLKIGDGETSWNSLPYISAETDLSAYYTATQTNTAIDTKIGLASATILGQLAGKSDTTHNHALSTLSDVEVDGVTSGQYLKFDGNDWVPGSVVMPTTFSYNDLTNVPTAFTPSSHIHAISDVTNLQTTLDGKALSSHTHAISDTTGLQTALDGKAAVSHSHTTADISDISSLSISSSQISTAINTITSAYTTLASDSGKLINSTSATAISITVSNTLSIGQSFSVFQSGAGILSLSAGSGVTLQGAGVSGSSLAINDRYSGATVFCISSGVYAVLGNVSGV